MSREIKFRVWDKVNNKMITYETMCPCPDITLNGVLISHDKQSNVSYQYVLMQYTGLKDKNGKDLEWYAGDIIQKGEIIRAITVDWEHGMRFMLGKHILCKQDGINGTKIGDIHTTPGLLEDK